MQDNYFEALRMLVERRVNCVRRWKDLLRYYCKPSDQHCHQSLAEFFHGQRSNNQQCRFREEQVRSNERSHSKNSRNEKKQAHPTMRSTLPLTTSETLLNSEEEKARETASGRTQPVLSTMTKETLFGEE